MWTGPLHFQLFSAAGKGAWFADERHLWTAWSHLIEQCRPTVIFGEQVASQDGYAWLDLVQTDVEAAGYAFGPVVLPAAGFGAPHGRHQIYFVADAYREQFHGCENIWARCWNEHPIGGAACRLDDANGERRERQHALLGAEETGRNADGIPEATWTGEPCAASPVNGFWRNADWLLCRDDKWRPVEPGAFPLAHGPAARVGRLRAYGNAIVSPVAETFVRAFMAAGEVIYRAPLVILSHCRIASILARHCSYRYAASMTQSAMSESVLSLESVAVEEASEAVPMAASGTIAPKAGDCWSTLLASADKQGRPVVAV